MGQLSFDIAHLFAGGLVFVSFLLLYQDRMSGLINTYALHAIVLSLSVGLQAYTQDAPHLYVTAAIALLFKGVVIPVSLRRIMKRLGIHREVEIIGGVAPTMLLGIGLVALSMVVMLPVTATANPLAREDLAFALSVVLLGLLMMVSRRNAVSQVIGFMSMENGLVLAATGAKGMPLVVEISVAFSVLIAFIVIGIFLFRIRERFDTVDVRALDRFQGRASMTLDALHLAWFDPATRGAADPARLRARSRAFAGLSPDVAHQCRRRRRDLSLRAPLADQAAGRRAIIFSSTISTSSSSFSRPSSASPPAPLARATSAMKSRTEN